MQKYGIWRSLPHQLCGDRIAGKIRSSLGCFAFFAHGSPHIGIDRIGSLNSLGRIGHAVRSRRTGLGSQHRKHRRHIFGVEAVIGRAGNAKVRPHHRASQSQRPGHIVGGSYICHLFACETRWHVGWRQTPLLRQSHKVGQGLQRVRLIRQQIHHRHRRSSGELCQHLVAEDAQPHDAVIAAESASDVGDGLSHAELYLVWADDERMPAQLHYRHLHRVARASRRLLKHERAAAPLQQRRKLTAHRQTQHFHELGGCEVVNLQEVAGLDIHKAILLSVSLCCGVSGYRI